MELGRPAAGGARAGGWRTRAACGGRAGGGPGAHGPTRRALGGLASASSRERGGHERGPTRRRAASGGGGGRAGAGKSNDPQRLLGRFITVVLFAEGLDPGPSAKSFLFFFINFFADGLT